MSGRIKRPLDRAVNVRDASLFVIATEGAKTEPAYFEAFKSPRVRIEVLPTSEDNRSAPKHVVERLRAFKKKFQLRRRRLTLGGHRLRPLGRGPDQ